MKNLIDACIISVIYVILVLVKNKFAKKQNKEPKPNRDIMQESILVFISAVLGFFAIEKMNEKVHKPDVPTAFLGKPEF